jgi:hypothetical protein
MEDSTTVTKHMEIRPSSEMGPIICCLDTSGSMYGARETVAKVGSDFTLTYGASRLYRLRWRRTFSCMKLLS